jgi:N-methylhydantoinase A
VRDATRTVMLDAAGDLSKLERAFSEMERESRTALRREGFIEARQRHERTVAARYRGQSFELEIKFRDAARIAADFHRAHLARYGYEQRANGVELVSARVRSRGLVEKIAGERSAARASATKSRAPLTPQRFAEVYFDARPVRAAIYAREELVAGVRLRAPCVVTEYSSTTLVPAGTRARVDERGNLIVELSRD